MKRIQFRYKDTADIDRLELETHMSDLRDYLRYLDEVTEKTSYDGMETSVNLPLDSDIVDETCKVTHALKNPKLKYVFVCGIGGSNLGPLAVYEAITSKYDLGSHMYPKIISVDTVSPLLHRAVRELVDEHITDPEEIVLSIVSKSGSTTETIANADAMYTFLTKKLGNIDNRVVVTTLKDSALWKKAEGKFTCVDHRDVGGRFSVMSAVGQLPLRLVGFDVDTMLDGATDMRTQCLKHNVDENPALVSALIQYAHFMKGVHMNDNFYFDPEMEGVGKWYRQLMAESLGKELNNRGDVVYNGLTPTVSIGSADLHSMVQLYLGGPRDKLTTFVYATQQNIPVSVSDESIFSDLVDSISGKSMAHLMDAIYAGVLKAYKGEGLPYMEIRMPDVSEYTLGQYMQFKMFEIMFLGKLMDVNTFNQPSVELYKSETRDILKGSTDR